MENHVSHTPSPTQALQAYNASMAAARAHKEAGLLDQASACLLCASAALQSLAGHRETANRPSTASPAQPLKPKRASLPPSLAPRTKPSAPKPSDSPKSLFIPEAERTRIRRCLGQCLTELGDHVGKTIAYDDRGNTHTVQDAETLARLLYSKSELTPAKRKYLGLPA
ncbi:MAG: hypothetical protein RLY93_12285 [Sumerlaeia bacterium]